MQQKVFECVAIHFESPQSGAQPTISHLTEKERLRKERVHHLPPLRRVSGQEGHYTVVLLQYYSLTLDP